MLIYIESLPTKIESEFLNPLAETCNALGHEVKRGRPANGEAHDLAVVWNGDGYHCEGKTIYVECGWLPRWHYQVSPSGINADSHLAPWSWSGEQLEADEREQVRKHLEMIRSQSTRAWSYMDTTEKPVDIENDFILVSLQMEWDTNIKRHVPKRYRKMQALVEAVSASNPPWPIIFKQHPADVRRGNRHLSLAVIRQRDEIWPHARANIHQLLKSERCRGIVALNSNVAHDGLIWNVPAIVLGKGIWSLNGDPFLGDLPKHSDWRELNQQLRGYLQPAREAYTHYLMCNQWTAEDCRNHKKVAELLRDTANVRTQETSARKAKPVMRRRAGIKLVNVVAQDQGWLFEDMKRHFSCAEVDGVQIVASEEPERDADAWIYLRTREANSTPDTRRTLVQIHDLHDDGMYLQNGPRAIVRDCGAVVLTNPRQLDILEYNGISLNGKKAMLRPIGALEAFRLRTEMFHCFSVAWVGRPVRQHGKNVKRPEWFEQAVADHRDMPGFEAVLMGSGLEEMAGRLVRQGVRCRYLERHLYPVATYPEHYKTFDVVVITSLTEAGPMPLFEAMASGVPVVSTRTGWAQELIVDGENGFLVDSPEEITERLYVMFDNREAWFERREIIRSAVDSWTLEGWVRENVELAASLA